MLRNALYVVAMFLVFGVAGCSTKSVSERSAACATDWRAYGVTDGRLGVPADEREDFFADCTELGFTVDRAAYRAGREIGLQEYCTAETGYRVGLEGGRYREVCSGQADIAFRQGFSQGRKDRPRGYGRPSVGLGLGLGSSRTWGGVGLGFPFYHGGYSRSGLPRLHDYCFYNSTLCRTRGWY